MFIIHRLGKCFEINKKRFDFLDYLQRRAGSSFYEIIKYKNCFRCTCVVILFIKKHYFLQMNERNYKLKNKIIYININTLEGYYVSFIERSKRNERN